MKSHSTTCRTSVRSCRETLVRGCLPLAFAFVALLSLLGVNVAIAQAAPIIDGNLDDMISYAQSLRSSGTGTGLFITDKPDASGNPTPETIYNDTKFIPCPTPQPPLGAHWVNGVEIFRHVLAYVPGSLQLYIGIRSEGYIGDSDGNNNPDNSGGGTCNPNDNIIDTDGISGNELYAWNFDLNCDGSADGRIEVKDNIITGTGTMAGATGILQFRQNGAVGASGKDLEIQVNLLTPLPSAFSLAYVEANAFEGLSEDRSNGAASLATPKIAVQKVAEPAAICVGAKTRFTVTIQNTGQTELSVVAVDQLPTSLTYAANLNSSCGATLASNVNGRLTFSPVTIAAGANCTISFDAQASEQCLGPVTNVIDVVGTWTSACIGDGGSQSVAAHAEATVTCKAPPCVEVTATGTAAACPGSAVTISGTAKNCSPSAETIVVTVNGAQAYSNSVPAGQTVKWSYQTTSPADCVVGQNTTYAVIASATGDCGNSTKTATVQVRCQGKPCVELTAVRAPATACPGDKITISGTVKNCSATAENIVVKVNDAQVFSSSVAAGETKPYTASVTLPACTSGNAVPFVVVATATGDCPPADVKTANLSVLCNNPPCVSVTAASNKNSGCPNEEVVISGKVKNCGTTEATYTVTVGGVQAYTGTLAPNAEADYSRTTTLGNCVAGSNVPFEVVATAHNACGDAPRATKTVNVACKNPPCVSLIDVAADKQTACPGEAIVISGMVKNCGPDAGTYTVTVGGTQVFTGPLEPNATGSFTRTVTMTACTAGANVSWTVKADVTNSCGVKSTEQVVNVRCKEKPCVELTATGPESSCAAQTIMLSGKVKNCGPDAATILVTVGSQQAFNASVNAGAEAPWTLQVPFAACIAGQTSHFTVVAKITNDCGTDQKEATVNVLCIAPPCVSVDFNAPTLACTGSLVKLCGTVTNCAAGAEAIEVHYADQVQRFDGVAAGGSRSFCFEVRMPACTTGDVHQWTVSVVAVNACGRVEKTAVDETKCKLPQIKVKKAAESLVTDGGIIHYTIIVENPGEAPLQNVIVTDPLCRYTVYNGHANPAATTEPAVGANGTVTWKIPILAQGESFAITFEAKASLAAGGAQCPGDDALCSNRVEASGSCAGTDDSAPVKESDTTVTTIRCAAQNCPQNPAYWTQQCSAKTAKFSNAQLLQITAKVDDVSTFFAWASDSTLDSFCATVNPSQPTDLRKQAKRQFATLLANYSTDLLNLTPTVGGSLLLDPKTPINCGGFLARTVGELITEVDLQLVLLETQVLADAAVTAKYTGIVSCLDAINNGVGIPTIEGCEHSSSPDPGATHGTTAKLGAATPNPFSSTTQFTYDVVGDQANVSITVYNVAGRQVRTLVLANQAAGRYTVTWDGKSDDGISMTRGVYFVRAVVAGQKAPVQRVLYIRDAQ